jgi:hypothetical protein
MCVGGEGVACASNSQLANSSARLGHGRDVKLTPSRATWGGQQSSAGQWLAAADAVEPGQTRPA